MNKALVPLVVGVIVAGLGYFGVTQDMTVGATLTTIVTAFFVWLIPNR